MAIADEFHSLAPDGSPYLGLSLRHFDTKHDDVARWRAKLGRGVDRDDGGESGVTPRDYCELPSVRSIALRAIRDTMNTTIAVTSRPPKVTAS
jgi:hypothetical protein